MKKKYIIIAIISVLSVFFISAVGVMYWILMTPNINTVTKKYKYLYVKPNDSWADVKQSLYDLDCLDNEFSFDMYLKLKSDMQPQCGKYDLKPDISNRVFINTVAYGLTNKQQVSVSMNRYVPILARNISKKLLVDSAQIADYILADTLLERYGVDAEMALALFVRGSIYVDWCASPKQVFEALMANADDFWNEKRLSKLERVRLERFDVHILASIVEEESNDYEDKRMIAGVYLNRLRRGIPLQADPTARYAYGDFTINRVLNKHINFKSPYNTYHNAGLPPAPIRLPQASSIDAVLNYVEHKYIYICAKEDFSGTHNFATTLRQHNINANKYRRALNERKIYK